MDITYKIIIVGVILILMLLIWILSEIVHLSIFLKHKLHSMSVNLDALTSDFAAIKTGFTSLLTSYQNNLAQLKQIQSDDAATQTKIDELHAQAADEINQITAALTPAGDTPPAQG